MEDSWSERDRGSGNGILFVASFSISLWVNEGVGGVNTGGLLSRIFAVQTCSPSSWIRTGLLQSEHLTLGESWNALPLARLGGVWRLIVAANKGMSHQ